MSVAGLTRYLDTLLLLHISSLLLFKVLPILILLIFNQVMDIRSDNYRGNHAITAIARKNNQTYELKYSYPDLRLISSNKRGSSNVWQDDRNDKDRYDKDDYKKDKYKNHGKYKNNKRYKDDDIENSIKRDSRYPAIKQRAVNKVKSMGYSVKDV